MLPSLPSTAELLEELPRWWFGIALYGSGWLVQHTLLPADLRLEAIITLTAAGVMGTWALLHAAGVEIEGGQCFALTNSGERCQHPRRAGERFCRQVHQHYPPDEVVPEDERGI